MAQHETEYEITPEFEAEWNRVRHKVDTLSGQGVSNTPSAITIKSLEQGSPNGNLPPVALLKITSAVGSNTHRYNASIIYGFTNPTPSTLQESDLGTVASNQTAEVWNVSEITTTTSSGSTTTLTSGTYVFGYLKGYNSSNSYPVYGIQTAPPASAGLFPVYCSKDGGSDGGWFFNPGGGSPGRYMPPSYTYSVTDILSGQSLGSGLSPVCARYPSSCKPASYGTGYYSNTGFALFWCDEMFNVDTCDNYDGVVTLSTGSTSLAFGAAYEQGKPVNASKMFNPPATQQGPMTVADLVLNK